MMTRSTPDRSALALLVTLTILLTSWLSYVAGSSLSDTIAYDMVATVVVTLVWRIGSSGTSS